MSKKADPSVETVKSSSDIKKEELLKSATQELDALLNKPT